MKLKALLCLILFYSCLSSYPALSQCPDDLVKDANNFIKMAQQQCKALRGCHFGGTSKIIYNGPIKILFRNDNYVSMDFSCARHCRRFDGRKYISGSTSGEKLVPLWVPESEFFTCAATLPKSLPRK